MSHLYKHSAWSWLNTHNHTHTQNSAPSGLRPWWVLIAIDHFPWWHTHLPVTSGAEPAEDSYRSLSVYAQNTHTHAHYLQCNVKRAIYFASVCTRVSFFSFATTCVSVSPSMALSAFLFRWGYLIYIMRARLTLIDWITLRQQIKSNADKPPWKHTNPVAVSFQKQAIK